MTVRIALYSLLFIGAALKPPDATEPNMTPARTLVTLNIATTLKAAGVDVINATLGNLGLRVDVRGKAGAVKARDMLIAAGLKAPRVLSEGRGVWLVVGTLA